MIRGSWRAYVQGRGEIALMLQGEDVSVCMLGWRVRVQDSADPCDLVSESATGGKSGWRTIGLEDDACAWRAM